MKKIIITGASGYIGSCLSIFLQNKYKTLNLDKKNNPSIKLIFCNLLNSRKLDKILTKEKPEAIIHLAAQSLVDETINKKKYYANNVIATNNLVLSMKKNNINNLIFSSTAAVYKYNGKTLKEYNHVDPKSTYAKTKLRCEEIIKKSKINSIILRFFNVCSSLRIKRKLVGEFHNPETHLIPTIVYKNIHRKKIFIYGNNYKTNDGTCIRDYIHIKDICRAIEKSINFLFKNKNQFKIINIGSASRNTNLQILKKIQTITKIKNNFFIAKRRKGDVDILVCSNTTAAKILNWRPLHSKIETIIKDEILWVKKLIKLKKFRKFKSYN